MKKTIGLSVFMIAVVVAFSCRLRLVESNLAAEDKSSTDFTCSVSFEGYETTIVNISLVGDWNGGKDNYLKVGLNSEFIENNKLYPKFPYTVGGNPISTMRVYAPDRDTVTVHELYSSAGRVEFSVFSSFKPAGKKTPPFEIRILWNDPKIVGEGTCVKK